MEHQPPAAPEDRPTPRQSATTAVAVWVALASLVVGSFGFVAVVAAGTGPSTHDQDHTADAFDLSAVAPSTASHYRFAADHQTELARLPCYCGCEEFLDHRHLADCFVAADGSGWDAHAAGCGVCLAEAAVAESLLEQGQPIDAVRAAIDTQFGTTPVTVPAGT